MNLTTRFTLVFIIVSMAVFIVGGVISYNVIRREIKQEEKRFLLDRHQYLLDYLERRNPQKSFSWDKSVVTVVSPNTELMRPSYSDTLVMHPILNRLESFIKLDAVVEVEGTRYHIIQYDLIVESDDIVDSVVESLLKTYFILLGAFVVFGVLISYFMFQPFRSLLSRIRAFSIKEPGKVTFPRSNISEFDKLNRFLSEMTKKVSADYQTLKEFTENASHELQTPIAIVQGKLDNLLENTELSEDQAAGIVSSQHALNRLSKLTKSLSLLTKIDNKEFDSVTEIDLSGLINQMLGEFKELFELKEIKVDSRINSDVKIKADQILIELLLTNLLNNAIKHNRSSGNIEVSLTSDKLTISNSGAPLTVEPEELFQRFKKNNQSSPSTGLGLAIVKKICDHYSLMITYRFEDDLHIIEVEL